MVEYCTLIRTDLLTVAPYGDRTSLVYDILWLLWLGLNLDSWIVWFKIYGGLDKVEQLLVENHYPFFPYKTLFTNKVESLAF